MTTTESIPTASRRTRAPPNPAATGQGPGARVEGTDRRTAADFAHCMWDLGDIPYPDAQRIRVVVDNLSTHTASALYENGALRGQYLDCRIGERETLIAEITAWKKRPNASSA